MARKHIDEHTLKVLEFEQVREILASFASSSLGKQASAALYPSLDAGWIEPRLAETSELKGLLEKGIAVPLAGLSDIGPMITNLGRGKTVLEPGQLLKIADTLAVSWRVKNFIEELAGERFLHLRQMAGKLEDFTDIVSEINRCVEDEKTICSEASPKLRELREQKERLSAQIERRFRKIISEPQMRKAVENENLLLRHGRVVVAIKTRYRQRLKGIVLDRSNTGATLYIEPEALIELSNELEDATFAEQKEVGRILWELTHALLNRKKEILACLKALSLFDLTYAKARFSLAYGMAGAAIGADCCLNLRQARHPLLISYLCEHENCQPADVMDAVVPIDVRLGDDFDLLLVTGPNTGGKTVMLKTIGVLTLMAQSGMHIPAHPDSSVGVYRQIFADIGDEQSIQQSLSTFSAHISRIIGILKGTNDRTLALLDELGAGTDPVEGAVLATSILDKLLARGAKTVATTHLGRLKSYAYTTPRAENASVQFDMETLKPTYKVRIGTPGSSNALAIARRLGMSKNIINQAGSLLEGDADGTSELINQVQATREEAERRRSEAGKMLDDARSVRAKALKRLREIRHLRKIMTDQANQEIDKSMSEVRRIVDEFFEQTKNAPKPWSEHVQRLNRRISEAAASTPLAVRQVRFVEGLHKGDTVFVVPFRRNGIVYRVNRKRRKLTVLVEGKQVQIPFTEVIEPGPAHSE